MANVDSTYATICSLLPYPLTENKPGLHPNEYIIKEAKNGIGLTVIPNNVFYLINPDPLADAKEVRQIKVPVNSMELAQSIINDYCVALLGVEQPTAMPGLFVVKGNYDDSKKDQFLKEYSDEIGIYRGIQNNWFIRLVDMADDIWSKTKSPIAISDLQRDACTSLGYKRDWLNPMPFEEITKCPICKNPINEGALKCIACGFIINKAEYDKLMIAQVVK